MEVVTLDGSCDVIGREAAEATVRHGVVRGREETKVMAYGGGGRRYGRWQRGERRWER